MCLLYLVAFCGDSMCVNKVYVMGSGLDIPSAPNICPPAL